ncbi:hypothetical protein MKW98_006835 [Papaver atlanticum]|uniref:Uncharacterized protein n=1 Tax=Papaver atlanticum TaxID=357466 RepID=A0AAD4SUM6_9MAGN|nr:hypothetical protein MKW98_006835 [Papaver atlanticum]
MRAIFAALDSEVRWIIRLTASDIVRIIEEEENIRGQAVRVLPKATQGFRSRLSKFCCRVFLNLPQRRLAALLLKRMKPLTMYSL